MIPINQTTCRVNPFTVLREACLQKMFERSEIHSKFARVQHHPNSEPRKHRTLFVPIYPPTLPKSRHSFIRHLQIGRDNRKCLLERGERVRLLPRVDDLEFPAHVPYIGPRGLPRAWAIDHPPKHILTSYLHQNEVVRSCIVGDAVVGSGCGVGEALSDQIGSGSYVSLVLADVSKEQYVRAYSMVPFGGYTLT